MQAGPKAPTPDPALQFQLEALTAGVSRAAYRMII
jgi:hypothetical protein